jgi:hypothetical protein
MAAANVAVKDLALAILWVEGCTNCSHMWERRSDKDHWREDTRVPPPCTFRPSYGLFACLFVCCFFFPFILVRFTLGAGGISVSIMTRLPDDRGSIPGRVSYFSSPPQPDRLWGPRSLLLNDYRGLFPHSHLSSAQECVELYSPILLHGMMLN